MDISPYFFMLFWMILSVVDMSPGIPGSEFLLGVDWVFLWYRLRCTIAGLQVFKNSAWQENASCFPKWLHQSSPTTCRFPGGWFFPTLSVIGLSHLGCRVVLWYLVMVLTFIPWQLMRLSSWSYAWLSLFPLDEMPICVICHFSALLFIFSLLSYRSSLYIIGINPV